MNSELVSILKTNSEESSRRLRDMVTSGIAESIGSSKALKLENIHKLVCPAGINKVRVDTYEFINRNAWRSLVYDIAFKDICNLVGPDLAIQRKINLSIHMPGDAGCVLPIHSDSDSGETPFQLNVWIPLTACYDTNSMQIYTVEDTLGYYHKKGSERFVKDISPESKYSIEINFGDYLLFPPTLLHGNMLNTTDQTRVSLNVRVRPLLAPDLDCPPHDRSLLSYYDIWNQTQIFRLASEIYSCLEK